MDPKGEKKVWRADFVKNLKELVAKDKAGRLDVVDRLGGGDRFVFIGEHQPGTVARQCSDSPDIWLYHASMNDTRTYVKCTKAVS